MGFPSPASLKEAGSTEVICPICRTETDAFPWCAASNGACMSGTYGPAKVSETRKPPEPAKENDSKETRERRKP